MRLKLNVEENNLTRPMVIFLFLHLLRYLVLEMVFYSLEILVILQTQQQTLQHSTVLVILPLHLQFWTNYLFILNSYIFHIEELMVMILRFSNTDLEV